MYVIFKDINFLFQEDYYYRDLFTAFEFSYLHLQPVNYWGAASVTPVERGLSAALTE